MRLIVGLGNPGNEYKNNRHNLGFLLTDRFAASNKLEFKRKKNYDFCRLSDVIIIKPKTFMNRSGVAVTSILTENRLADILVVVDDINLPVGEIRLRRNGGYGGHNGLKSIGNALGTDNFKRLRIGVGSPINENLSDYVLSDFSPDEFRKMNLVLDFAEVLLQEYVNYDFDRMVELYSRLKKSYSEKIQDSQDQ
jgi:PTH1 family peptidyl-tRNA hydrolase